MINKELDYPDKNSIAPGLVSIIYKNSYKFNVDNKTGKLSSIDNNSLDILSNLINKYHVKKLTSLLPDNADLTNSKKIHDNLSNKHKIDFPELGSLHCYEFPADADTVKISEELRKLPFIETAYPTIKGTTSSTPNPYFVSRQGGGDRHKNVPTGTTDPFFGSLYPEIKYYSWFNHHKIFQTWDIYRQVFGNVGDISQVAQYNLPTIAVIDEGFYKGYDADAPTYFTGVHYDTSGNYVNTDTSQHTQYNSNNPDLANSHGTSMANIIASPKNNGVALCGVAPNARIYPFKVDFGYDSANNKYYMTSTSWVSAINYAQGVSGIDVINLSLELTSPSRPVIYDSQVNIAIAYAVNNGKSVVISAGNGKTNLDSLATPNDYGAVIVGGSSSNNGQIWDGGSGLGSNYGFVVSLATQAQEIFAPTWQVSTNQLYLAHPNDGNSGATAIVSGILGMMKKLAVQKGVNYTPQELRDVISYSGTLGVSTIPSSSPQKFLGRGLTTVGVDGTFNNVSLLAEMRDLNAWSALSVVNNSNFQKLVRIFNNDDYSWATTNGDWNARYTQENYFDEAFWGFSNLLPAGTTLNLYTNNTGGNGSLGYQVYDKGKYERERLYGVLTRYNSADSSLPVEYNTIGPSTTGWFGGIAWNY